MQSRRLLRLREVSETVGAAPSTIREWLRDETKKDGPGKVRYGFPKPVTVNDGERFLRWYSDEIADWINALPRAE